MKSSFLRFVAVVALSLSATLPGSTLCAQDEGENNSTSGTTYDSTGLVIAVSAPGSITINSRRGPFTYALDQDLHIIGPDSKPLKINQVHAGQTVTVYYYKHLGTETAARLVVLKDTAEK